MTTGSARLNEGCAGGLRPWKTYFGREIGRSGPLIPTGCLTCANVCGQLTPTMGKAQRARGGVGYDG